MSLFEETSATTPLSNCVEVPGTAELAPLIKRFGPPSQPFLDLSSWFRDRFQQQQKKSPILVTAPNREGEVDPDNLDDLQIPPFSIICKLFQQVESYKYKNKFPYPIVFEYGGCRFSLAVLGFWDFMVFLRTLVYTAHRGLYQYRSQDHLPRHLVTLLESQFDRVKWTQGGENSDLRFSDCLSVDSGFKILGELPHPQLIYAVRLTHLLHQGFGVKQFIHHQGFGVK